MFNNSEKQKNKQKTHKTKRKTKAKQKQNKKKKLFNNFDAWTLYSIPNIVYASMNQ